MPRIGYARVSSTGQSLEIPLEKLNQETCDRIYQEKRSGRTADHPELQSCMNYLRGGDTLALIITRLDRLAWSVVRKESEQFQWLKIFKCANFPEEPKILCYI